MFTNKFGQFLVDMLEVLATSVAIFLFVYLLVLQPHKIKGQSMEPNFHNNEYLLTDKVTYRFKDPKRGDVIVFEPPGGINDEFIKRIIGLPGETLLIKNNKLYINGQILSENYLPQNSVTYPGNFLSENTTITVPNESFFVLGDNRNASSDSRSWGFVSKYKIRGKAWIIYWPLSKVGLVHKVSY